MKNIILRNDLNKFVYTNIVKKICFEFDAEKTHNFFIKFGKILGSSALIKKITSAAFNYQNELLEQDILGIKFTNPVGLSAGFDKNAELLGILGDVGFGFAEVGSVTARSCKGNSGVRLKRIPEKRSIFVNFGLNNKGANKIHSKLKSKKYEIPFGVSIAKTNCKETADPEIAVKDYVYSIKKFKDVGQYITINISCPNAYGGQPFSNPELYNKLLKEVSKLKISKPLFVKLSPDLDKNTIDKIIKISNRHKIISGFICSNLTKKGLAKSGGFSGKIVADKANELLAYAYKKTKGKYILMGVGGIFSAEDAYKKIKLGANLVQLITGMIYEGPNLISEINRGLVNLLKKDGYSNIGEAVGADFKNKK